MEALRLSSGHLPDEVAAAFQANPALVVAAIQQLFEAHFPTSLHDDILDAVGLPELNTSADNDREATTRLRRDPGFRERIHRAYEHQCAVTGFRAALSSVYFGCEAAHVKWHAYEGPDTPPFAWQLSGNLAMATSPLTPVPWANALHAATFYVRIPAASIRCAFIWRPSTATRYIRNWMRPRCLAPV